MINFKLNEIDTIEPWGQADNLSLHWFGLTYGDLWLTFGTETIYEYTKEVITYWGGKSTQYNDYPLARFIEDFTALFYRVGETMPDTFYDLSIDLKKFQRDAKKWLALYNTADGQTPAFYDEEYDTLMSWRNQRTFGSGHLIAGPQLSFFRRNDKVNIVWETDYRLENGIRVWTAKDGSVEMDYAAFKNEIRAFGQSFFAAMDKQIALAVAKEWGVIKVDKQRLVEEQQERKDAFFSALLLLEQEPAEKTNWAAIAQLVNRMHNEI